MKIKTGDTVRIMTGKDKGKEGKVTQVFPTLDKVVVEGLNQRVKHVKRRGTQAGQRITYSGPIAASNVQIVGKEGVGRVGYVLKDGKKVRVLRHKKSTEELG
ncbi:50S ribosomal protein L24 [Candidatus Uhrbacteria bacterium]|nr:50S ribosomal protein L24 [Candidatus Uhrbacteria bacterium]